MEYINGTLGISLKNFFPTLATLVFVAIATCFLICNTENDVHFSVYPAITKWLVKTNNQIYS